MSGVAGAALALAAGCGSGKKGSSASSSSCVSDLTFPITKTKPQPTEVVPKVAGTPIGWTAYPKPYTTIDKPPGTGGNVSTFQILWGSPPPAMAKNPWWQGLNKRLGVTLQPTLAAAQDYGAKLLTLAASGSFPDITYINFSVGGAAGFQRTVSEGAFHDLTQYLSGDGLKEFPNLARIPALTWTGSSFQGKIFGVPYPIQPVNGLLGLYRKDWAEKLGVDNPKSPDEVLEMFKAFRNGDPNGDGKKNTYGMNEFVTGLWMGMYRAPNNWRLNSDGTLAKDMETDEYKEVIAFTQKLWKAGVIHPDALTLTSNQQEAQYEAGRTGLWLGGGPGWFSSGPNSMIRLTKQNDPKANSQPWLPPGHDGGEPAMALGSASYGFGGIPSSIKDEKKVVELIHLMEYWAAPFGSEEFTYIYYGIEGKMFHYVNGTPVSVTNGPNEWGNGINYLCGQTEINYYYPGQPGQVQRIQKYEGELIANATKDPTMGLYSPTWVQKSGTLVQMQSDTFNSIAVGRKPMSYLDEAIQQWKSQGGDTARKEFQDALQKCK